MTSKNDAMATLLLTLLWLGGCAVTPQPQAFRVERDLVYAERADRSLYADLYLPQQSGRKPAVVVIHGGGWYRGEREQMAEHCEILARRGFVVANVGYRFAPAHVFPAQLHDVKEAVRWLRVNAERFEIDPEAIAAYGYSAGAHLALLLGLTTPADGLEGDSAYPGVSSRVGAVIAGGAPVDLGLFGVNQTVGDFVGARYGADTLGRYRRASPISYLRPDSPPLFLFHGRHDWVVPVEQTELLYRRAGELGVEVEYRRAFFGHLATFFLADEQVDAAAAFLLRALR